MTLLNVFPNRAVYSAIKLYMPETTVKDVCKTSVIKQIDVEFSSLFIIMKTSLFQLLQKWK